MTTTSDRPGFTFYLYCLMSARDGSDLAIGMENVCGIGGLPVTLIPAGEIIAVLSALPAEQWQAETIETRLSDPNWVEREVLAHEAVVERCLAAESVLPCKFLTIFSSLDAVLVMLAHDADRLRQALERVTGRREWAVKLLANPAEIRECCERTEEMLALVEAAAGRTRGQSFFLQKQYARELNDLADRQLEEVAATVDDRLTALAGGDIVVADAYDLASGEKILLNLALLLPNQESEALRAVVEELGLQVPRGFRLTLSGPWPPYHFTGAGGQDE